MKKKNYSIKLQREWSVWIIVNYLFHQIFQHVALDVLANLLMTMIENKKSRCEQVTQFRSYNRSIQKHS